MGRSPKRCSCRPDRLEQHCRARGGVSSRVTRLCRRRKMRERRMQHLDEGTIHAWLDGALSVDEAAKVEAHVAECAQCAAAVAEARGFIAGASRILTALDSVPGGVVPVATARKRTSWPVWRAAAAILVVALGSFVALRDRIDGNKARVS